MDDKTLTRFFAKVEVPDDPTACWVWRGAKHHNGYGTLRANGRMTRTHRLAYEHWHGPIPAGLSVLHRCDVPACVNPVHLWVGSHAANMVDMVGKRRQPHGAKNGRAKLSETDIIEIRLLASDLSQGELSRQYGVSHVQICHILAGKKWRHI